VPASEPVAIELRIRYQTVDELIIAYDATLSHGSAFIKSNDLLPIGTQVKLWLELPQGAGEIAVTSRVASVRDRDLAANQGGIMGMSLEFLDLKGESLTIFEDFIVELSTTAQPLPAVTMDRKLRLVVIDDDFTSRERVAQIFHDRGDDVHTAADGFEGLALCLKQTPDAILTDVTMPRMDGWQLLRMIRARPSLAFVPVVFLTSLDGERDRLQGYQLGVDDYISKPHKPDELCARIDRLVARMHRTAKAQSERKTLRGDLNQVTLGSLLSFIEGERLTGELIVVGRSRARLAIRDGALLRVELNEPVPASERIYRVLDWTRGQFDFVAQAVEGDEKPMNLTGVLLEHARRSDERAR